MRILLVGIGGVFNYGCEAIVRGTVAMLRTKLPQAAIFYASLDYDRDRKALGDLDIQIVDVRLKKHTSRWLVERVRRRLGLGIKLGPWYPSLFPPCDVALSIGGDIYTIDANTVPAGYRHSLVEMGEHLIAKGIDYVLWGASVGPFTQHPEIEAYYRRHLQKCALITAREDITKGYLDRLGCAHVAEVADPAFFMAPAARFPGVPAKIAKTRIGLNLSRLSIAQRYPREEWSRQEFRIVESIRALAAIPDVEILLIPHVQPGDQSADDDCAFLEDIQRQVGGDNLRLLPPGLGAPRTKRIIAECDLLIAARMHCAIAGCSSGVPTLFLAYSSKALGMAEYVYGHRRFCLRLDEIDGAQLVAKAREIQSHSAEISARLKDRLATWQSEALAAVDALLKATS